MVYTLLVLAGVLLLLCLDIAGSDVIFGAALILLLFGGIISPEEALAGFSNKGMITVGLLFIVSQAVNNTGIFQQMASSFLGASGSGASGSRADRTADQSRRPAVSWLMLKMMAPVTLLSAFLNNTPIVTIFTPVVKKWAQGQGLAASKFLIPLSYAAIFGGLCTLIGTSTNLVVHGLMIEEGMAGLGFFELAKVGIPVGLAGYLYMALLGQRLLPDRPDELARMGSQFKEYFIEMVVPPGSPLIGRTITEASLRNLQGVYLTDIERGSLHIAPVTPDRRLAEGDRLFFAGRTDSVADVLALAGLEPVDQDSLEEDSRRIRRNLTEVVVSANSRALGKTIREFNFRSVYDAAVVAVSRNGERVDSRIGDIVVRPGDTMVLLTRSGFVSQYKLSRDFYLVSSLTQIAPEARGRGGYALAVVLAMILVAALGSHLPRVGGHQLDMFYGAAAATLLMVLGKTIRPSQARNSIRWAVLITIGAAFGVSKALSNSGAADLIAGGVVALMSPLGVGGVLLAVLLVTSLFTELITNNAAAALVFPLALAAARNLGVDPLPFFVAVAVGASASFATPIGYQTNLIVQGAGGYRFRDYLKVGLPMNLLTVITGFLAVFIWYY